MAEIGVKAKIVAKYRATEFRQIRSGFKTPSPRSMKRDFASIRKGIQGAQEAQWLRCPAGWDSHLFFKFLEFDATPIAKPLRMYYFR
jgi:hypothetical protein